MACLDSGHSRARSEETSCQGESICYEIATAPLLGAAANQSVLFIGTENQIANQNIGGIDEVKQMDSFIGRARVA